MAQPLPLRPFFSLPGTVGLFCFLLFLFPGIPTTAVAEPEENTPTRPSKVPVNVEIPSISDKVIHPFRSGKNGTQAAVVIFILTDCPIANKYAPEIERIRTDYLAKGVKMTLIQVEPELTAPEALAHARDYALKAPIVIDRTHQLVKLTGARVTPEAVVIDSEGAIRYRGRINDQFTELGDRRRAPKTHDLREALDAVLNGKEVVNPETEAVGCLIQVSP